MKSQCLFHAISALLAASALAAPALEKPGVILPRDACPTTTWLESYSYLTLYRSTTTVTNGVSWLGSVTSTQTVSDTRTYRSFTTIISPSVTTIPGWSNHDLTLSSDQVLADTSCSYVTTANTVSTAIAVVTTTIPWNTYSTTITSAGYAPDSVCQQSTPTIRETSHTTSHVTYTYDLEYVRNTCHGLPGQIQLTDSHSYVYTTKTEIGHVSTKTETFFTTQTITATTPGGTTYAATVTQPYTATTVVIVFPTSTYTQWQQGCKTYACQL